MEGLSDEWLAAIFAALPSDSGRGRCRGVCSRWARLLVNASLWSASSGAVLKVGWLYACEDGLLKSVRWMHWMFDPARALVVEGLGRSSPKVARWLVAAFGLAKTEVLAKVIDVELDIWASDDRHGTPLLASALGFAWARGDPETAGALAQLCGISEAEARSHDMCLDLAIRDGEYERAQLLIKTFGLTSGDMRARWGRVRAYLAESNQGSDMMDWLSQFSFVEDAGATSLKEVLKRAFDDGKGPIVAWLVESFGGHWFENGPRSAPLCWGTGLRRK
jgi:hypothetical protein